jgi:AcrR family transcriptional regulator
MPRGFTEHEKASIRSDLIRKGRALFETHGLRKTNVDDLTQAVAISKGAFYLFFESKEALFFAVLQQAEAEVRQRLLGAIDEATSNGRERFRAMLHNVLELWRATPLFAQVGKDEYAVLLRRLPPALVQEHLQSDIMFAQEFVAHWQQAGVVIRTDPALVSELIRALFFLSLHEQEFGAGLFPQVADVLIDGIVRHVVVEDGAA